MLRIFLPAYLLIYFLLAFAVPTIRVRRETGKNPIVLGGSDSAHDFIGRIFKLLLVALTAAISAYAASEEIYGHLEPYARLEIVELKIAGVVLLMLSLGWIVLAQYEMRDSWRIGVDYKNRTSLIRTGVFRVSRNPIFLGIQATLLGVFLVLPNALTLLILILGVVLIHIQARLEEEFLAETHGPEYKEYRRRVRRWL